LKKLKTLLKIIERIINTGQLLPKHLNTVFDTIIIMTSKKDEQINKFITENDVLIVENLLNNWYDSAAKIPEFTKKLPKEITNYKLKLILSYLKKRNKVLISKEKNQIIYVPPASKKLLALIKRGTSYP